MIEFSESPEEQEDLIEEEAKSKIRQFVDDPHLKFHFSRTENLPRILSIGINSRAFSERIEKPIDTDWGYIDKEKQYRSVSIVDRDQNKEPYNDHWIKIFTNNLAEDYDYGGAGYMGILLPSDLKVRDYYIHANESHVPIRISPQQFQGLFVVENERLMLPGSIAYYPQGEDNEEYQQKSENSFKTDYLTNHFSIGGFDSAGDIRAVSKILNIPERQIRPIDILIYFAKKARVPLYTVNREFSSQEVIWPAEKKVGLANIQEATSFQMLYDFLDTKGGVQGSNEYFTAEELKDIIEKVRTGQLGLEHVTRSEGLRETVGRLMQVNSKW